jgi:peptidylprolyl isomerase
MKTAARLALIVLMPTMLAAASCAPKDDTAAPPDMAAPPADALRTPSGLASKMLRVGVGTRHPGPTSLVTVHYTGWTTDGRMFDTSVGQTPPSFPLDGVIPGWTEGVQLMVEGEKRRFWIPGELAYDNIPVPEGVPEDQRPPRGMLVFDIELIRIR